MKRYKLYFIIKVCLYTNSLGQTSEFLRATMDQLDSIQLELKAIKYLNEDNIRSYFRLFSVNATLEDDIFCDDRKKWNLNSYREFLLNQSNDWIISLHTVNSNIGIIANEVLDGDISVQFDRLIEGVNLKTGDSLKNFSKLEFGLIQANGRLQVSDVRIKSSKLMGKKEDFKNEMSFYLSSALLRNSKSNSLLNVLGTSQILHNVSESNRSFNGVKIGFRWGLKKAKKLTWLSVNYDAGVGFGSYKSSFNSDSSLSSMELRDEAGDTFFEVTQGRGLKEDLRSTFTNAEIGLDLSAKIANNGLKFYVSPLIGFWYNLQSHVTNGSGTFTYFASFPQFNLIIKDEPDLGYSSDNPLNNQSLEIDNSKFIWVGSLGIGLRYEIPKSLFFCEVGAQYWLSIGSNYRRSDQSNILSPMIGTYQSMSSSLTVPWPEHLLIKLGVGRSIKRRWHKRSCRR